MKAIVQERYGGSDTLLRRDVADPTPKDDEALIAVRAAALHIGDVMLMRGEPYVMRMGTGLRRPKKRIPGFDFAGVVETVGKDVSGAQPGDEVYGEANGGSCAEWVVATGNKMAPKPAVLTFEEAAAVPVSGVTALRGIRDAGKVKSGDRVLINGATGGVGIYAIQIAKSLGAEVTAVCGPRNIELARELGADHVIDYTQHDYTQGEARYDLILDNVANRSLADARKAVAAGGSYISNSARSKGRWFGAVGRMLHAGVSSLVIRKQGRPFYSPVRRQDLLDLTHLIDEGKLRPVIDRTYALADTQAAMDYVAGGHASGKTVITIAE
jgi:NADPH:quinone reductase-like Zn-dependent oxidoreductase